MRLAVLSDYLEDRWPSMDLAAEMLHAELSRLCTAERLRPPFRHRFGVLPGSLGRNADRLCNRFWDYPRFLRGRRNDFDLFHVVDHSYAQLVHALPAERTGVFCHDLDTFRCLIEPRRDPRPKWFRVLARHVLAGMQKAAVVFHTTDAVRAEIERHGLIDSARLVRAPLGPASEFTPEPESSTPAKPFLLHVGSCVPRKRIDILLDTFAAARRSHPELRLVKVGGPWTDAQRQQLDRLGLAASVTQFIDLSRGQIAELYRRAALVLVPSEAEGFGLPVVEALACGAAVVASDIAALREVGGDAVTFCPVGDGAAWGATVAHLLTHPDAAPPRDGRLARARLFSWESHARIVLNAYLGLSCASSS